LQSRCVGCEWSRCGSRGDAAAAFDRKIRKELPPNPLLLGVSFKHVRKVLRPVENAAQVEMLIRMMENGEVGIAFFKGLSVGSPTPKLSKIPTAPRFSPC
jgi:hypothetical protein